MRKVSTVTALALALLACNAVIPPAATPEPALTSTNTAEPTPSRSSTPAVSVTRWKPISSALPPLLVTLGPTLTPSPTRTLRPPVSPTGPIGLGCRLDWKSPGNGWEVRRGEQFSAGWKLTNTGIESWTPGNVVFTYVSGAQLHNDPVVPFDRTVASGSSIILSVRMRAPENSTLYTTYWSLRQGDVFFCRVSVTIYVK